MSGELAQKYIAPPFSVLNTRAGYWQKRKKELKAIGLYNHVGRDDNVLGDSNKVRVGSKTGFSNIAVNVSEFDPVLAEIVYKWFLPHQNCAVLDPFAGGVTRGGVAALHGHNYCGFDTSVRQITENVKQLKNMGYQCEYINDTSINVDKYYHDSQFDLIFSCPPYYNLEVYTDDPNDLSTLSTYHDFVKQYSEIIRRCATKLKENRFACFVVGDIRDKQGFYYDFISDTINAFDSAGLRLYNNAVLLEQCGTKAMTSERAFVSGRKLAKVHQNVLIFYNGDPKKIKSLYNFE